MMIQYGARSRCVKRWCGLAAKNLAPVSSVVKKSILYRPQLLMRFGEIDPRVQAILQLLEVPRVVK